MKPITKNLIASCGMNCAICKGYLREKNSCPGCRNIQNDKSKSRLNCKIRTCQKRKGNFCDCKDLPCDRLKRLDDRYKARYGMSEIENLEYIKKQGINKFVKSQRQKYQSPRGTFCIHDQQIYPQT